MEEKVATTLKAAKTQEIEEGYQWVHYIKSDELLTFQNEHPKMQRDFGVKHQLLRKFDNEKYALTESLHKLRTSTQQDLVWYQQEMEEEKTRLNRSYEHHATMMEQKVAGISTSYELVKAKPEFDATTTKDRMNTLRVKYEMGKERVKALLAKHPWKSN